jgi:hypothetical protein
MHVHVSSASGEAKFWLEPLIALESHWGLHSSELRVVQKLIEEHADEVKAAWKKHFGR